MSWAILAAGMIVMWGPSLWAADETTPAPQGSQTEGADTTYQTPEGPGPAPGPLPTADAIGYKPIPESMLPVSANAAVPLPGASANLPPPTNLGGAVGLPMGPYTLGRDDVVHIMVQSQPEFSGTYAIGHNGAIQYGFVGDVMADGLTKEELADVITERLKKFVRVPSVRVTIVGFNSKAIYILGRVARPGKYAMRGDTIKIRDAVIAAGLVVQHARLRKVHIVKSDPTAPTYRIVDLHKVLYKGQTQENVDLVNGDIIVVPTTAWGAVNDFLSSLLSPAGHAGSVAALAAL